MGTIIEILTTNYETEDYYGTYVIYKPNYDKTCELVVPCLSPTSPI